MKSDSPAVLVVDDEEDIREALSTYLGRLGYSTDNAESAETALRMLERRRFDLVITDMKLPGMDGIEMSKKIKSSARDSSVIVITGYGNIPSALEALQFGADDYLLKPFTLHSLKHAVEMVFEKKRLEAENLTYRAELERKVKERSDEIQKAGLDLGQTFYKTIHIFGNALESRETYLYGRTERITILAYHAADSLGWDEKKIARLLLGAPISDVGKLALPEAVLLKTEPLSEDEISIVRSHVKEGARIVADLAHFREVIPIIQLHHERFDGSGYPFGLKGEKIPDTARLVAICDSFDAMTHSRPWRRAKPVEKAVEELRDLSGTSYDPEMVDHFLCAVEKENLDKLIGSKPTGRFFELALPILAAPEIWPS